jgi:hypothetical protein
MAELYTNPARATDTDGNPLSGAKLYFYQTGTTTPVDVYEGSDLATPLSNPVEADSAGLFPAIYRDPEVTYRAVLKNSSGSTTVYDIDPIGGLGGSAGSADVGFIHTGSGAVVETVQTALRRVVWVEQFGAVGDGTTDDTTPLTNFFNHAMANPGVPHMLASKTYAVTAALPTINVSNVWIEGSGAEIHDVGTLVTGTVIKWTGATSAGVSVVTIQPDIGASAQRLANITFKGIGIDCNSGEVGYGLTMKSVQDSEINVAVANASNRGVELNVVATLGEARDLQRNLITLNLRQIEAPAGLGVVCSGDATANTSMNHFWIDGQHKDSPLVYCVNSDNNDYHWIRAFRAGGGTAAEGVSLLGGETSAVTARAERIHFYTGTVGVHVYGTGTYAAASVNSSIYRLDTENATPNPTIDAGSSLHWAKDISELTNNAWIDYTPTIAATSGTITTSTGEGRYLRRGNIIYLRLQITITTNGTGAGAITATLPVNSVGSFGSAMSGRERAVTAKQVSGFIDGGGASVVNLLFYDGTYPGANGHVITAYGAYEIAQ